MNEIELTIQIYLRQPHSGNGEMSLSHRMTVKADGFMELCKILAQFDELGKKIKEDNDSHRREKRNS